MKSTITYTLAIFLVSLFISIPGFASQDPFTDAGFLKPKKQVTAPDFTLEDLNQNQVKLSDYRGKTVLVFFWTTW